jgi:hypothetical protein
MRLSCVFVFIVAACAHAPGAAGRSFGGTYHTTVSLTSSNCSGVGVMDNPTTVAHTAGAATFTMTHAGQTYTGTVSRDGRFVTAPKPIVVGPVTHTLTIKGVFGAGKFTADVHADVSGSMTCKYVVHWVGSQ